MSEAQAAQAQDQGGQAAQAAGGGAAAQGGAQQAEQTNGAQQTNGNGGSAAQQQNGCRACAQEGKKMGIMFRKAPICNPHEQITHR